MLSVAVLVSLLSAAPDELLLTTAEKTAFARTGRYEEVERLCRAFERGFSGRARCFAFGTTPEKRPMLALVASADGSLEPSANRARRRPVILIQGGIHAGELDGKDAGFMALRRWLAEGRKGRLAHATALFVPVFNVDGHERFGPHQRPNQRGPEEGGWRTTARNLNLNRDYVKADAPEMRALLALVAAWDPAVHVDLHVTNGAKFQHDVSVSVQPTVTPPDALRVEGEALAGLVQERLAAAGHLPLPFYPEFRVHDDPSSGIAVGVAPPRYNLGYAWWRNRIGVLVEAHSWKPYAVRVRAAVDVLEAVFAVAAERGAAWLDAGRAADAEGERLAGGEVTLDWEQGAGEPRIFSMLGYAWEKAPSFAAGRPVVRYDESRPETWKMPIFADLRPAITVRAPRGGYVVPPAWADMVADRLAAHGVVSRPVKTTRRSVAVEAFRAGTVTFETRSVEGRQPLTVRGTWQVEVHDVIAGSLYVPAAQPRARLAVHMLEPTAPDSLLAWGFFNAAFERTEYMEDYVAAEVALAMLRDDPSVRAEFEARLQDPAFAKDSRARLDFFYRRHPAYDARFGLYPVLRIEREP